jgi:hypothetical protein
LILKKEVEMSATTTVPPFVNQAMKFVLCSPVHSLVRRTVLLVTFTRRKTGKTYTTPVSYSQSADQVSIFTHAVWWKNLDSGAQVTLRIRGRELRGVAETIARDKRAIAAELTAHLREVPSDARYYGVTFDDRGNPRAEEVEKAVQTVVMVRVWLC